MRATALIADPAGDSNVQPQIQVSVKRGAIAREAVHHRVAQQVAASTDHWQKPRVGVPFMQKQRQTGARRLFQMPLENPFLLTAGRKIAKEIQARFPDRHHLGRVPQGGQLGQGRGSLMGGVMGMHPCGAAQHARVRLGQRQSCAAAGKRTAGDHQSRHARRCGPRQHRPAIGGKAVVRQVGTDIDQAHYACTA